MNPLSGLGRTRLILLILGAIHALSFAPHPLPSWALPFVQIVVLAMVFTYLYRAARTTTAAVHAFVFGVGNFTLGLYWLFISMHNYGGLAWPLAALGVLALACFLSIHVVLATVFARWIGGNAISANTWRSQLLISAVWASSWTLTEWLRGTLLTGFPWLNTGYAHIEGVLAPWAPLVGVYGVSWIAAFASASIAMLVCHKDTANDARAAIGVGLAIVTGLAGIGLSHVQWSSPQGDPFIARLVQGNVPQSEKFDPELFRESIRQHLTLSGLAPKSPDGQPSLIVLPETVIPVFQDQMAPEFWDAWIDIARQHNATILMGVPLHGPSPGRYTNSAIAFNANTSHQELIRGEPVMRYDKHHLVPFGEFVPTGFRWFVEAMRIPLGDFNRGATRQALFRIQGQDIAPDICYEDVFGEEIIQQVRDSETLGAGASILINISNLAWFGDTWALRQHLQIARMRAIETSRPILRATNTGMTAAIDPYGVVRALLQPAHPGVLDVEVQGMKGLTPYVQWGNRPVITGSLVLLLLGILTRLIAYRNRTHVRSHPETP